MAVDGVCPQEEVSSGPYCAAILDHPPTIFNGFDDPGKGLYASPPTRVSIPHFNKHQYSVKYIISGAERGEFGLSLFISSMSLSKSLDFPNSEDF